MISKIGSLEKQGDVCVFHILDSDLELHRMTQSSESEFRNTLMGFVNYIRKGPLVGGDEIKKNIVSVAAETTDVVAITLKRPLELSQEVMNFIILPSEKLNALIFDGVNIIRSDGEIMLSYQA